MQEQQRREAMRDVAGVPTVPREQAQRVATASPATQLAGSRRQGARTGADGGRTGGGGQAGLACRRARRWQVSAVAGVAVVGGVAIAGGIASIVLPKDVKEWMQL